MEETVAGKKCIELWENVAMPGVGAEEAEHLHDPGRDTVMRVTSVSCPAMYFFPAETGGAAAPLMIVCPGGGYNILAWDLEGTEIAARLNADGMSAMVLKYRVPGNPEGAYMDVQRAIRVVRARAAELNIDPERVGVMGFSAGGNLSARAATGFNRPAYQPIDDVDALCPVPNFAVLVYPAYLNDESSEDVKDNLNPMYLPLEKLPPILVLHNEDDKRFVRGSKVFVRELRERGFDIDCKIWQEGGHGYGLRSQKEVKAWGDEMIAWFRSRSFLA